MHIKVIRQNLLKNLGFCQSVVERRNTIAILGNVLLQAGADGMLTIAATDLDMAYQARIPAEVIEPGVTTVSAQMLFDIVRKIRDGQPVDIKVSTQTGRMDITSGSAEFQLSVLDAADFPKLEAESLSCKFSISPLALRELIDRTKFAMSIDESRYTLNGIYFHAFTKPNGQKKLRMAATDGLCLARLEVDLPEGADEMPGVILGRKTVMDVRKLIEDLTDPIQVELSPHKLIVRLPDAVLTARVVEGTFPDYERAIPIECTRTAIVNVQEFADNVDRVSVISSNRLRPVRVALSGQRMEFMTDNQEAGQAQEEMMVEYNEDPIDFGFNARYLLDISAHLPQSQFQMRMTDSGAPILIQGVDESGRAEDKAVFVVMPMRI